MNSSGKRVLLGAGVVVVLIVLVFGARRLFWPPPKPVTRPQLTVVGVGLYLGRNQETHKFEIRRVFPNSPAEKAGIAAGLVLNKVDGILAETNNIKGVSALLMGPVGTKVKLEVLDTNGESQVIEVLREPFLNRSTNSM